MGVHVPVVWSLRGIDYGFFVRTYDEDAVAVDAVEIDGGRQTIYISRKDARLLARRLNQCLDDTNANGKYGRGHRP